MKGEDVLTDCAKEYGALQSFPYVREHKACVPTIPAFPSRKMTVYASATAYINDSGLAWGTANFGHGIINTTSHMLYTSKSSQASTVIDIGASKSLQTFGNSDYSSVSGIQYRVVAAGVRFGYSGPIKDVGGVVTLVETPDHETINGKSRSQLAEYDESSTFVIQPGSWYSVEWHPADPSELQYDNQATGIYSGTPLGFIIEASSGEFLVEAYCHYEVVGSNARSRTPSHADPNGMAAAMAVNSSPGGRAPSAIDGARDPHRAAANKIATRLSAMAHYVVKGISGAARKLSIDSRAITSFASSFAGTALKSAAGIAMKAAVPLALAAI